MAAATLFAVAFLKLSPIWIILTTIVVAVGIALIRENKTKTERK